MYFGQKTHPLNFEYASTSFAVDHKVQISGRSFEAQIGCEEITDFCTKLHFDNANVIDKHNYSDGILEPYRQGQTVFPSSNTLISFTTKSCRIEVIGTKLMIRMTSGILLETTQDGIGFNGEKFILNFQVSNAAGFYGFGERTKGFNKRGDSMDFWNVDVVAVFPYTYGRNDYDPTYVAIPFAIVKIGSLYTGIYFDNPGRAVIDVEKVTPGQLMYQSLAGNTDIYLIDGPSLRQVVQRFTFLTGRAPVPPLWSMGYHQSRWGYQTEADFLTMKDSFAKFAIPVSAFWYDIDYMDEYRLFTWDKTDFPTPDSFNTALSKAGIRTVAILDPGIKREPGYAIYEGNQAIFCKTLSGKEYVGRVWPGDVVFPDFSLASARDWWAEQVAKFMAESAIDGIWLDMNDPATGYSAPEDMRFANGKVPHDRYHNQYAHFMAKASLDAFAKVAPKARPFLLTRSGFTGTQRYSAIWTGDNASNWQHLQMSIPCTINLGLSGVAINGPDIGGYMGHTTAELLTRWYQAGFLFPFFRNHSVWDCKAQEPWQFGPQCLEYIRATITTRYRLLPYLYTCFFHHYLKGDPIVRPLLYEYEDEQFENLEDQFLVGDSILVAPIVVPENDAKSIVAEGKKRQLRHITFPPGWWFDLNKGTWLAGGRIIPYAVGLDEVPLFVRDGAILPFYNGPLNNSLMSLQTLELHIFSKDQCGQFTYFIDDQETQAYQVGHYNTVHIRATVNSPNIQIDITESGQYPIGTVAFSPVLYGYHGNWQASITHNGNLVNKALKPAIRSWVCKDIPVLA